MSNVIVTSVVLSLVRTISPDLALSVSATLARVFKNLKIQFFRSRTRQTVLPALQRLTGRRKLSCSVAFCFLQINCLRSTRKVSGFWSSKRSDLLDIFLGTRSRQIVSMSYQSLSYLYHVIGRATSSLPQFFVLW